MLGSHSASSELHSPYAFDIIPPKITQTCCQVMINALVEHGLTKTKIASIIAISTRTITNVSSGRVPALKPLPFKKLLMLYCGTLEKPIPSSFN